MPLTHMVVAVAVAVAVAGVSADVEAGTWGEEDDERFNDFVYLDARVKSPPIGMFQATTTIGTSVNVSKEVVVQFGGLTPGGAPLENITWELVSYSNSWVWQAKSCNSPPMRAFHTLVTVEYDGVAQALVYGGAGIATKVAESMLETFEDAWMYNAADNCKSEDLITQLCQDHCHVWTPLKITGTGPGAVAGHTAGVVGKDRMVVLGGCSKLSVEVISKHVGEAVDMVAFMLTLGDNHSAEWSTLSASTSRPQNRFFHIGCAYVRSSGGASSEIVIMSGWAMHKKGDEADASLDDAWILKVDPVAGSAVWYDISPTLDQDYAPRPFVSRGASLCLADQFMAVGVAAEVAKMSGYRTELFLLELHSSGSTGEWMQQTRDDAFSGVPLAGHSFEDYHLTGHSMAYLRDLPLSIGNFANGENGAPTHLWRISFQTSKAQNRSDATTLSTVWTDRMVDFTPSPRYGHSLTLLGDGNQYMYGGHDGGTLLAMWRLGFQEGFNEPRWHLLAYPEQNNYPPGRWCHTATKLDDYNVVLVGGITGSLAASEPSFASGIWKYTLDEEGQISWQHLPMERELFIYGHATVKLSDSRLLVTGGILQGNENGTEFLLHSLDLNSGKITRLRASGAVISARYRMSAAMLGRVLVIIGGWKVNPQADEVGDRMWTLDLSDEDAPLVWKLEAPSTDATLITHRYGHCVVAVDDRILLLHGGTADHQGGHAPSDVHMYDRSKNAWLELFEDTQQGGVAEVPGRTSVRTREPWFGRSMHTCALDGGRLYAFGGRDKFNLFNDVLRLKVGCPKGYHWDGSTCHICPMGTFSDVAGATSCTNCSQFLTTNSTGSTRENECNTCDPKSCHGHGKCYVEEGNGHQSVACHCDYGFQGRFCEDNLQYIILAVGVTCGILLLALIAVMSTLKRRRMKVNMDLQEHLLMETRGEVAALRRVWEIDPSEITLHRRIDGDSGFYGEVWRASWGAMEVAVKLLRKVHLGIDGSMSEEFEREIEFMQQTRHANMVRFFGTGTMSEDGTPFLVEELMECSLTDLLRGADSSELSWAQRLGFYDDIASGMAHIHSLGHIHRDLKSGNILMQNNRCKVADFGSVRSMLRGGPSSVQPRRKRLVGSIMGGGGASDSQNKEFRDRVRSELTSAVGTAFYMAPEMLKATAEYDRSVDVWSYGVLMHEIASQLKPDLLKQLGVGRRGPLMGNLLMALESGKRLSIVPSWPLHVRQLMAACWQRESGQRPSFAQVLHRLRVGRSESQM